MTFDVNNFEIEVLQESKNIPVVVDFWAEWCGPCKVIGPILEKHALNSEGRWILAKINTETHPAIAAQYNIRSIPNIKLFVNGNVVDEFMGALPESQIVEWLNKVIPSKYQDQIEYAKKLWLENNSYEAQKILQLVLDTESENQEATVLLAQTLLNSDTELALSTIKNINLGSEYFDKAEAIRIVAKFANNIRNEESLRDNPTDLLYKESIEHIIANQFESALNGFLQIIRRDRKYDDEGPRKLCVAIFNMLGPDNEISRNYRARLSRELF